MKSSDLTESEKKVWDAAATGTLVDLRVGDSQLDSPEKWAEWGPERTVRAEAIADLLIGDGDAASTAVRGVRLQGARIMGELNLEAITLRCRLALLDCSFASDLNLEEATAVSVRLSGSHVLVIRARQLVIRGDLRLDKVFCLSGGVELVGAHIGGGLDCTGAKFSNSGGQALNARRLTVDGDMFCRDGFSATGEVSLVDAHIGGWLSCTGGRFSKPGGRALYAEKLIVDGSMSCDDGFSATGEVSLFRAHIGDVLDCTEGHFSNSGGRALNAEELTVDGAIVCQKGFSATGEVRLARAHIGGLDCTGAKFSNSGGRALNAEKLIVDGDMFCRDGFSATGEVNLLGAHIGGWLSCTGGRFSNPDGSALTLHRAAVSGPLFMESAVLQGVLDLTAAETSSYHDNMASWPEKLRLDGFVYDAIEGASTTERLEWLRRNETGYSPQIYEQLAAVYRSTGHEENARRVLIAKQRRRSAEGNLAGKLGGFLLDWTVGYGYRTWLAALWLVGLLALGTYLFGYAYRGDLTPASKTIVPPPFQPFLYTLDLLLPVVSLHVRDAWVAHGAAQWWSVIFIVLGWILATAVVLSLTGLLKRD
jgi:hypothetical protein